jgi:hypothetical protein
LNAVIFPLRTVRSFLKIYYVISEKQEKALGSRFMKRFTRIMIKVFYILGFLFLFVGIAQYFFGDLKSEVCLSFAFAAFNFFMVSIKKKFLKFL